MDAGVYPAGGHYRFDVAPDGAVKGERKFMSACFPLDMAAAKKSHAEILFLTHFLDRQPTEIHAFVSRSIPLPLAVITIPNKLVWVLAGGRLQLVRSAMRARGD